MKKYFFILSAAFILGCGNDSHSDEKTSGKIIKKDCLKNFDYDFDKVLSKEEIASVHPIDIDDIKIKKSSSKGEHSSQYYQWASDRPDKKSEINPILILPDDNQIGISSLQFHDTHTPMQELIDRFSMSYKPLSPEEIAKMNENLENKAKKDPSFDLAGAKKFLVKRAASSATLIDGLGNRAYWVFNAENGGKLTVLNGNTQFMLSVKVSEEESENLNLAKELTKLILKKC